MSAGLPGLGLGGLFFIFSALLAPFRALWRTLRGRSRPGEWAMVGRQFAQAVVMVAAIDLSLRLAYIGIAAAGLGNAPSAVSATVIPLTLIGITSALLLSVLVGAKFAQLAVGLRTAALPRVPDALPRPTPLRAMAVSGVVAAAWLALLTAGASELSPLVNNPRGEQPTTDQRPDSARSSALTGAPSRGRPLAETSAPVTDTPRAADVSQPLAEPGYGQNSSGAGVTPQPNVSIAQSHSPTAAAPKVVASPAPGGSGNEPKSAANPSHGSGPPTTAGPPEGSSAPEHAGPPEHAGSHENSGTEHSRSSTARASRGI
jgi:hypothetical protein